MISYPAPAIDSVVEEQVRTAVESGATVDEAVWIMRHAGLSKIPSIKLVQSHFKVSLVEAKSLVHLSPAWEDSYEADERFHQTIEDVATREEPRGTLSPEHAA